MNTIACTCGAVWQPPEKHAVSCPVRVADSYSADDIDAALFAILGSSYDPNDRVLSLRRAAERCFLERRREDRNTALIRRASLHHLKHGVILPEDRRK